MRDVTSGELSRRLGGTVGSPLPPPLSGDELGAGLVRVWCGFGAGLVRVWCGLGASLVRAW